jgi:uncharacterized membrane protein YesL
VTCRKSPAFFFDAAVLQSVIMRDIWPIIKKSVIDLWDEMLYLVVFNVLWFVGTLLIVPWPFVTFALFYIARDVTDGKGIKWGKFFQYGRGTWRQAYTWGAFNIIVLGLLVFNILFYARYSAQWAALLQLFFVSLTAFWIVLQLMAVALYPNLVEPSLRLATRNAAILMGRHPLVVVFVLAVIIIVLIIAVLFPALIALIAISYIAVLITVMVDVLVEREMGSGPGP